MFTLRSLMWVIIFVTSIWLITYSEKVLLNTDFLFEVVASQTIFTVENRTEARLQAKPVHFVTSIKVKTAISNKTKKKSNSTNSPDLIGHPVVTQVDCNALIRGDIKEKIKAQDVMKREARKTLSGEDYLKLSRNCTEFKLFRGYATDPLSSAEEEFPIAFSVLMYKDIEQSERLLRAIYQPQNHYCIHVDKKSPQILHEGMSAIARCFHNVFIVQNPVTVRWGCSTVLEPDLLCMRQLWPYKNWKYFINLTGQEFPLRTNLELVEILKAYKGANNIEGTRKRARAKRWQKHLPAPQGIIPSQGNVHITASRGYVNYILHNQTALCFLDWVNGTRVPDETFFSTLNHNPHLGVPGSYRGEPESNAMTYPYLTRYISWSHEGKPCHGKFVRKVCIFGVFDLPYLTSLPHLFVNKFHWDYQHFARDCLEEWHFNRTVGKHFLGTNFNVSYYGQWDFVWNKVNMWKCLCDDNVQYLTPLTLRSEMFSSKSLWSYSPCTTGALKQGWDWPRNVWDSATVLNVNTVAYGKAMGGLWPELLTAFPRHTDVSFLQELLDKLSARFSSSLDYPK